MEIAALIMLVVPVNFVSLTGFWSAVSTVGTAVGAVLSLWVLTRARSGLVPLTFLISAALVVISQLAVGLGAQTAVLFAPLLIGLAAALSIGPDRTLRVVMTLSIINAGAIAIEFFSGQGVVAAVFGTPLRAVLEGYDFRPRGFIGQPVPGAFVELALAAVGWILAEGAATGRRRASLRFVIVILTVSTLAMTGTRSALAAGALIALVLILRVILGKARGRWKSMAVVVFLATALALVLSNSIGRIPSLRILDFTSLSGTDSLDGRLHSLAMLEMWWSSCDDVCKFAGSGVRSLESALASVFGILGLTTIDNMYVTLLWDFGILGALALIALIMYSLAVALSAPSGTAKLAGAVLTLTVGVAGLFMDSLYSRPLMLLLGFGVGLIAVAAFTDTTPLARLARPVSRVRRAGASRVDGSTSRSRSRA